MKRRSFLYSASLGTLGFSYFSGLPSWVTEQKSVAMIDELLQAVGAQTRSWLITDVALEKTCEEAMNSWKQVGYAPLHRRYFMCRKEQTAIYTLCLRHEQLGLLDVTALVFQKEPSGDGWRLCSELSGFQLEALNKAAKVLGQGVDSDHLANLLLPAQSATRRTSERFHTTLGEVSVSARLKVNKAAEIKVAVYENSQVLWQAEYTSQYLQPA